MISEATRWQMRPISAGLTPLRDSEGTATLRGVARGAGGAGGAEVAGIGGVGGVAGVAGVGSEGTVSCRLMAAPGMATPGPGRP